MSKSSNTEFLRDLMGQYTTENLRGITPEEFRTRIDKFLALNDHEMEGYDSPKGQRHESVKFHWGHNHDFGDFQLEGKAGDRHITVISKFMELGLPRNLEGQRVLDVGAWTGGTSLLLVAMGGNVVALEEVYKYAEAARLLEESFNLPDILYRWDGETPQLIINAMSLYDEYVSKYFNEIFDYVIFAGVLYHLTDPVLALRTLFNCLKDGGKVFIESACQLIKEYPSYTLRYAGPSQPGWNWFIPSEPTLVRMLEDVGFEDIETSFVGEKSNRVYVVATRRKHKDMLRAGLSRRDIS